MAFGNAEIAVVLKLIADQYDAQIKRSRGLTARHKETIRQLSVAVVGLVTSLTAVTLSTAKWGDELAKTSQRTGLSVEELQGLGFAAEQSGSSFTELVGGLRLFQKNLIDFQRGVGEAKVELEQLGLTPEDVQGKEVAELLFLVADRFSLLEDATLKAAIAQRVFGRSGTALIPFLNNGAEGLKRLMKEMEQYGVITTEQAKASERLMDQLNRVLTSFKGLKNQIGAFLIPVFISLLEWLDAVWTMFQRTRVVIKDLIDSIAVFFKALASGSGKDKFLRDLDEIASATQDALANITENQQARIAFRNAGANPERVKGRDQFSLPKRDPEQQERLGQQLLKEAQLLRDIEQRRRDEEKKAAADRVREAVTVATEELRIAELTNAEFKVLSEKRVNLLRASNRQELADFEGTQAERVAIVERQNTEIVTEVNKANISFFDAYKRGLKQFVEDTEGDFGLAITLARETALAMTSAFQTFFFDLMNDRISSLQDILRNVVTLAQRIGANVAAQLATQAILGPVGQKAIGGGGGFGFDPSQQFAFAEGGRVRSGRNILVGERGPELFIPGSSGAIIPNDKLSLGGGTKTQVNVFPPNGTTARVDRRQRFGQEVIDVIIENVNADGALRTLLNGGV